MDDRSVSLANFHTFGELLKYLRKRAQLTQIELSIAVGYSASQISRLEANLRVPDRISLLSLFIPALSIHDQPEIINRLLELAQMRRTKSDTQPEQNSKDPLFEPQLPFSGAEKAHSYNLPIQLTSFIGRETEITALCQLITTGTGRLVTLTGSGGVGKTRLAIRVAEELGDEFADGVWLVELAPLTDPGLVAQAVATALSSTPASGQTLTQALCDYLRRKRLLLILDNCEHVISTTAELADTLLRTCPYLYILATSREILGVSGETPFRCPSLSLPDPHHLPPFSELTQSEAVYLFVQRAQNTAPGFNLTEANAALIVQICRRLDGIPLAIELAAARLRLLSIEQIAARLEKDFHLLTGGNRTELPRHQTLKALIDWSYQLLPDNERLLLKRLSVFAWGWMLEAAENVCADKGEGRLAKEEIVDLLGQLVDKSLVIMAMDAQGESPRYRMLETIRQFAHEKLMDNQLTENGELPAVRQRHLEYILWLVLQTEPHLRGKGQQEWLNRMDVDLGDIRLALEWALANDIEKGLQIAAALEWFWHMRNHWMEGIDWLERLLLSDATSAVHATPRVDLAILGEQPRSPARCIARGKAINALVNIKTNWVGDENLIPLLEEARAIFEAYCDLSPRDLANTLGLLAEMEKDLDRNISGIRQALVSLRKKEDDFLISDFLCYLTFQNIAKGDFVQARANAKECLARARKYEDLESEGAYLTMLGELELMSGSLIQAALLFRQAQSNFSISGNRIYFIWMMSNQAIVAMSQGNYSQAIQLSKVYLESSVEVNEKGMMLDAINFLGWEFWALKDYGQASRQSQKGLALARELRPILGIIADSNAITAEYILGRVAMSRGEYFQATTFLKGLLLSKEVKNEPIWHNTYWSPFGFKGIAFEAINALGVLANAQHQAQRAATLFGAQAEMYDWQKNTLSLAERDEYEKALAATRNALGELAFTTAWDEGRGMTIDQAVQYALGES